MGIQIVQDREECSRLWATHYPCEGLFDLWDVRDCFARAFNREPYFIVYEEDGDIIGFLPLCKIDETGTYAFYPGETWHGKTWMEQNKIVARDDACLKSMLRAIPGDFHLRYLTDELTGTNCSVELDEIGYLFYPANYDYTYDQYLSSFPGKSRKKIVGEIEKIKERGISFRYNELADVDWVFNLNISSFGEQSYFYEPRFLRGFQKMVDYLKERDMLRIVTLMVDDAIAAVDIGAIFNNQCTLLAGGTHREYPGVAKVINMHHLEWACRERLEALDFLCGDFGWKERFRLLARPLYLMTRQAVRRPHPVDLSIERIAIHAA